MENVAVAKNNNVRISASKVKIVIDLIRNKPVGTALAILKNVPKAASEPVEKLLISAIANAENNHGMDVESLYVAEVFANQGPTMKRIRPRAQGRAFRILKRTSKITIVLKEKEGVAAPAKKPATKAAKAKTDEVKEEASAAAKKNTTAKKATASKTTAAKKTTKSKADAAEKTDATEAKPRKPRAPRKKAETTETAVNAEATDAAAPEAAQE